MALNVFDASMSELQDIKNVGEKTAPKIKALAKAATQEGRSVTVTDLLAINNGVDWQELVDSGKLSLTLPHAGAVSQDPNAAKEKSAETEVAPKWAQDLMANSKARFSEMESRMEKMHRGLEERLGRAIDHFDSSIAGVHERVSKAEDERDQLFAAFHELGRTGGVMPFPQVGTKAQDTGSAPSAEVPTGDSLGVPAVPTIATPTSVAPSVLPVSVAVSDAAAAATSAVLLNIKNRIDEKTVEGRFVKTEDVPQDVRPKTVPVTGSGLSGLPLGPKHPSYNATSFTVQE